MIKPKHFDVIIIGGGFYGCYLGLFLVKYFPKILILEKEKDIIQRASYVNQARVHMGYHYPRSFVTASRSCRNYPRFINEFKDCIYDRFDHLYAIANENSYVNAHQFKRFCTLINAPLKPASAKLKSMFNHRLIEEVFMVNEVAYDAKKLKIRLKKEMAKNRSISLLFKKKVKRVFPLRHDLIGVTLENGHHFEGRIVFNCTYSGLNSLLFNSRLTLVPLKHELAEIALIDVPAPLKNFAVTVMDGPFFSIMPFPPLHAHSLTHVRYTPHNYWHENESKRKTRIYNHRNSSPKALYMLADASRYIHLLAQSRYRSSLFDIKTLLPLNETDDGRPILFRSHYGMRNFHLVLGSKIDNIYDICEHVSRMLKNKND